MSVKYQWKAGARFKVRAQDAGEELERLRDRFGGSLTPAGIIDAARARQSPIHKIFEWDDSTAAQRHREWQARMLLNSIRAVVVSAGSTKPKSIIGYVHVNLPEEGNVYVATDRAMQNSDLREQVLQDALNSLAGWQRRYRHLNELRDVFRAIKKSRQRLSRRKLVGA